MLLLAIETGTFMPSVALLNGRQLLASSLCQPGQSLTSQLLPTIDRLLVSAGVQVGDLQGLAVSIGPGSFTGLRVGMATMSALRLALAIPMVGVSSLEALAWNVLPVSLPILSTIFIKPGHLYFGLYEWSGEAVVRIGNEAMGTVGEVLQSLDGGEALVVGDGWIRNQEFLVSTQEHRVRSASDSGHPSAQGVGLAGIGYLARGETLAEGTSPHYLQLSYAEVAMGNHHAPQHSQG
ncbi:MAG: tRNA (adenosine(37)-N6)-threonylcarbamoyltransferase complex dimerization subunit type 1 TsaB [Nitrospira sp.]|nr:tRNA (adenosine(37)-N6)-threonylcarbamoyltransferase complex dimerization subunit type 1 TsaB [Nitrospira sp.]